MSQHLQTSNLLVRIVKINLHYVKPGPFSYFQTGRFNVLTGSGKRVQQILRIIMCGKILKIIVERKMENIPTSSNRCHMKASILCFLHDVLKVFHRI